MAEFGACDEASQFLTFVNVLHSVQDFKKENVSVPPSLILQAGYSNWQDDAQVPRACEDANSSTISKYGLLKQLASSVKVLM